jgi:XTP/dITP diphosphohydrolase
MREIRSILTCPIQTLEEAGIESSPEETGETLSQNAYIKAKAAYDILKTPVLADDSGLFIEALGGAPGVNSARFAETGSRRDKVLELMKGQKNRAAYFETVLCYIDGNAHGFSGILEGEITEEKRGSNGFGYDSIFKVGKKTLAEMTDEEKNELSHRRLALEKFKLFLENTR